MTSFFRTRGAPAPHKAPQSLQKQPIAKRKILNLQLERAPQVNIECSFRRSVFVIYYIEKCICRGETIKYVFMQVSLVFCYKINPIATNSYAIDHFNLVIRKDKIVLIIVAE